MINLRDFCGIGPWAHQMITKPSYQNGYSYATNGNICVRIPGEHAEVVENYPNCEKLFAENQPSGQWQNPPESEIVYKKCEVCGGIGKAGVG